MLFCMCVGAAFAQTLPATNKAFTVVAEGHNSGAKPGWAINNEGTAMVSFGNTTIADEAQKNFAFVQYDGKVYLYSVWAQKFVQKDMSLSTTLPIDDIKVENVDGGKFYFKYDDSHNMNIGGSKQLAPDGWNTKDGGNQYTLTEVADFDPTAALAILDNSYTITYELVYNSKVVGTQVTKIAKGANYPAINNLPYGVVANIPEGAPTQNESVVITCTLASDFPFAISTLTEGEFGEGMKWYYLKMRNKDVTYDAGTGKALTGNVDKKGVNNLFAFTGNPFEGFSIYNFAAGSKKVFWRNDATDAGRVFFTEISETDGNTWMLSKNGDAGYVFRLNGHATGYMNDHQPEIAIWNASWGATDGGSTFTFEYVENPDFGGVEDLQAYIAEVNAYIATGVANGNTVGYITEESYQQVADALAAANTAVENRTGCIEALTNLKTAVANVKFIQPEEGKFYKIVSSCTKDHRAGQEVYVNNDGSMHFANADDYGYELGSAMSRVWQFVPAADGKFYIKNVERGVFMQSVGTATETDGAKAKAVTISNMGKNNVVSIRPDGQSQMHAQDSNSKIVGWNENNPEDGSAWVITEVSIEELAHTVTVGEAGYATLVLGYNAAIPSGVEVYTVSATEDGSATLTMIEGNVLAAGEAVVLKNAGTYDFKYTTAEATEVENLLKGTTVNANIAEASYVLGNIDGVGFYTATFNVNTDTSNDIVEGEGESAVTTPVNDAFKNNAFKAYLPKTNNAAQTLRFNFGETTGIEGVIENTNANAVIFDLSGRRVAKMQKGIYIVNGKKVYVK